LNFEQHAETSFKNNEPQMFYVENEIGYKDDPYSNDFHENHKNKKNCFLNPLLRQK